MNKYTHSKQPSSQKAKVRRDGSTFKSKVQRAQDRMKIVNHKTVERMFGALTPLFGGSLEATYLGNQGLVAKVNRAASVV
jgi:hypothetical protein